MATKTFDTAFALARAAAAAASKAAPVPVPAKTLGKPTDTGRTQLNVLLRSESRRKLKLIAMEWNTSERELIEAFIAQLPDVTPPVVAAPAKSVAWAKPAS